MTPASLREAALFIWQSLLNEPYKWGGDDPIKGFDCSGLVLEGLKGIGIVSRFEDCSAHVMAHQFFKDKQRLDKNHLRPGCLLFWEKNEKVYHVEIIWAVIGDKVLTIGASGGGSGTTDQEKASSQNAYVKIRPAQNWAIAIDPFV